tara:strand:- start:6107 stop:7258 length:1152 start_codon:yes stop_codon:yes gene_type:complete
MKKTKVFQLGLRGIPDVQGGIEKHVEQLAPLLVNHGFDVSVLARSSYQPKLDNDAYKCVKVKKLWNPKIKGFEALIHTFIGVCYSIINRPDILHIHAVGPSLFAPLARLFGLKVVMTHHGPDYDRQKWGKFAKRILELGEDYGVNYANEVIVISKTISNLILDKYSVESNLIPNGVTPVEPSSTLETLKKYNLDAKKYILIVSRLVPEKRHLDLISAFEKANIPDWKLVIVGSSDHPDSYSEQIIAKGTEGRNIITTGFLSGSPLTELFSHAGLFVLPSSHEGLPIAMLEAMSYGLPVIASAIPANLEVDLVCGDFFELGNVEQLESLLKKYTSSELPTNKREEIVNSVIQKYNWNAIAGATSDVYHKLLSRKSYKHRHQDVS